MSSRRSSETIGAAHNPNITVSELRIQKDSSRDLGARSRPSRKNWLPNERGIAQKNPAMCVLSVEMDMQSKNNEQSANDITIW